MGSQLLAEYNGAHQAVRRRCVVTGGRGFMARHLVAALLRSGEWFVRVTDLTAAIELGRGDTEELLGDALQDGRAVYSSVDVCSLGQLIRAFEGIDVVFHTAAADPSKDNLELHYKVNVEGTRNVIDACKICNVKRLIYTSSSVVVFDGFHGLLNVNESVPYPDKFPDAYGKTKAEAEKLVLKANSLNDLVTCCIRPGNIFGPGDHVIPILDHYGRIHFIIGEGNNYDDFVYVENVVHSHLCAEKTLSTKEGAKISGGKAYFITNMEPVNLWCFAYMARTELGYKRPLEIRIPTLVIMPIIYVLELTYKLLLHHYGMRQPQLLTMARVKYLTLNRTFSSDKAVEELGYKPIVSLRDGLRIAVESYIRFKDNVLF
ncbi:3beta-hydroxysteroid-dehydrogenase/decarboxylase-like [Miscanthus floridulus]|uniref:3beta-hydroxysteroid- dehydrogenase/decarboxylase-like n=1 Tax=Miscanthus floridulus TaxID=154761 RepID=UPI00345A42F7